MSEWQPIETAPKDGTVIDAWMVAKPEGDKGETCEYRVPNVSWRNESWVRQIEDGDYSGEYDEVEFSVETHILPERQADFEPGRSWRLSHWMPLPEPPPKDQ